MIVDHLDASRVWRYSNVGATHVERREGVRALIHAIDATIVTRCADARRVAGSSIWGAETLREIFVKMTRVSVVSTRVEDSNGLIVAEMLHQQLCRVGIDPTIHRVGAKTRHSWDRRCEACHTKTQVSIHRNQAA